MGRGGGCGLPVGGGGGGGGHQFPSTAGDLVTPQALQTS